MSYTAICSGVSSWRRMSYSTPAKLSARCRPARAGLHRQQREQQQEEQQQQREEGGWNAADEEALQAEGRAAAATVARLAARPVGEERVDE